MTVIPNDSIFLLLKDEDSERRLTVDGKVLKPGVILRAWVDSTSTDPIRLDLTVNQARRLAEALLSYIAAADARPRPEEGCDRCVCGCKYWDGDRCHSCGERFVP